jgi:hypothetical protein
MNETGILIQALTVRMKAEVLRSNRSQLKTGIRNRPQNGPRMPIFEIACQWKSTGCIPSSEMFEI